MGSTRHSARVLALLAGMGAAVTCTAASFSFTGTFTSDDNVRLFSFTLNAPSSVTIKTLSYGGGTNAAGQVIAPGGFATDLALFSGAGALIDFTDTGGCPPQNIDVTTGLCGDSVLTENLGAGGYLVGLTEFFNIPNGALATGFLEDGMGNFTGPTLCGVTGGFFDVGCNRRTGNFALDIVGATGAAAVPEPSFAVVTGLGLLAAAVLRRRRRC